MAVPAKNSFIAAMISKKPPASSQLSDSFVSFPHGGIFTTAKKLDRR
jgi:hypothetical protein